MVGHIKIDRKILNWEWYSDYKMVHLFLHLLIKANYKENKWQGRVINRGQLITGIHKLSGNTGLSVSQTRTCLSKLHTTGEIAIEVTNKYSIITICKYETYQTEKEPNRKPVDTPLSKQDSKQDSYTLRKQEDKKLGSGLPEKVNSNFVCYNAEEYVLASQVLFEKICMATSKKPDEVKKELHLYHLWLTKNEKYPMGKAAAAAGIESWIHNANNFKKSYSNSQEKTNGHIVEKLPDARELSKKYG